jgi:hypothetical protein
MKQKGFAPILVVLIFSAIFAVAGAGYWYSASNKKVAQEAVSQEQVAVEEPVIETAVGRDIKEDAKEVGNVRYYPAYFSQGFSFSSPDLTATEKRVPIVYGSFNLSGVVKETYLPFSYPFRIRTTYLDSNPPEIHEYYLRLPDGRGGGFEQTFKLEFGLGKYEIAILMPQHLYSNGEIDTVRVIDFYLINKNIKK